jgi:hypothetical protein
MTLSARSAKNRRPALAHPLEFTEKKQQSQPGDR